MNARCPAPRITTTLIAGSASKVSMTVNASGYIEGESAFSLDWLSHISQPIGSFISAATMPDASFIVVPSSPEGRSAVASASAGPVFFRMETSPGVSVWRAQAERRTKAQALLSRAPATVAMDGAPCYWQKVAFLLGGHHELALLDACQTASSALAR
jgi:hypothetical protein